MTKIYPYKTGSGSAKRLSEALGARLIRRKGSRYRGGGTVVNWGSSELPAWPQPTHIINSPVHFYTDKLDFFRRMRDDPATAGAIPPFAMDRESATRLRFPVVCRTMLNSHSGNGIVIAEQPEELVNARLYVQYIRKESEWRIHFFNKEVIDIQRKIRDPSREVVTWQVRNHQNGFIYARNSGMPHHSVMEATEAFLGGQDSLDFGALDIIYNAHSGRAYILEVNTAPGLFGQTLQTYAAVIREYIKNL